MINHLRGGIPIFGESGVALFVIIPMAIILVLIIATILFFKRKSEKDKNF
jgi:hypothetical protein